MRRLPVRRISTFLALSVLAAALPAGAAPARAVAAAPPPGAIEALNLSPTSRTVRPTAVYRTTGSVANPQNVLSGQPTRLTGTNSSITLDFGKEVGGLATLSFGAASDGGQQVGLAFSESSLYVGNDSDISATHEGRGDGALTAPAPANGSYTMPNQYLRGGFRYLTVFLRTSGWVELTRASLNFTPAPGKANPADYANYFYSNDNLLNRIWYGGAYTVQMSTIASNQGRAWPAPATLWNNAAVIGVGTAVVSDAAKRDRNVWPGDLGIATPTAYASTNEMESTRNALTTLYNMQNASGELPYSGPPFNLWGSDTYHMWTLNVSSLYYNYTADRAWLDSVWPKLTRGMTYIINKIDGSGLLNVTNTADWARSGQGGLNLQANALLYATLTGASRLAAVEGDSALATGYANRAATLKAAANSRLWDAGAGLYRDNPTSGMYPQDGNSLAVWYGLTDTPAKNTTIVQRLAQRWNAYGATTPEWGGGIHPFPGSMEVHAHFTANDDTTALAQIRRTWGYMLDSPIGTKSTMWEGISANGGLAYNPPFMSLSHGWSTGPTSALTFDVLGTAPEPTIGQYRFVPHPGDLTSVEGRITMPQGPINAAWSRSPSAGTFTSQLTSPAGTTGRVGIPKLDRQHHGLGQRRGRLEQRDLHRTTGHRRRHTGRRVRVPDRRRRGQLHVHRHRPRQPGAAHAGRHRPARRVHPLRRRGRAMLVHRHPRGGLRRGHLHHQDGHRRHRLHDRRVQRRPGRQPGEVVLRGAARRPERLRAMRRRERHLRFRRQPQDRVRSQWRLQLPDPGGRHRVHQRRVR